MFTAATKNPTLINQLSVSAPAGRAPAAVEPGSFPTLLDMQLAESGTPPLQQPKVILSTSFINAVEKAAVQRDDSTPLIYAGFPGSGGMVFKPFRLQITEIEPSPVTSTSDKAVFVNQNIQPAPLVDKNILSAVDPTGKTTIPGSTNPGPFSQPAESSLTNLIHNLVPEKTKEGLSINQSDTETNQIRNIRTSQLFSVKGHSTSAFSMEDGTPHSHPAQTGQIRNANSISKSASISRPAGLSGKMATSDSSSAGGSDPSGNYQIIHIRLTAVAPDTGKQPLLMPANSGNNFPAELNFSAQLLNGKVQDVHSISGFLRPCVDSPNTATKQNNGSSKDSHQFFRAEPEAKALAPASAKARVIQQTFTVNHQPARPVTATPDNNSVMGGMDSNSMDNFQYMAPRPPKQIIVAGPAAAQPAAGQTPETSSPELGFPQAQESKIGRTSAPEPVTAHTLLVSKAATGSFKLANNSQNPPSLRPSAPDFIQSVCRYFQSAAVGGVREIYIRLNPEHLGMMRLKLQVSDDKLSGKVEVSSPEVQQLLVRNTPELSQRLESLNIVLEKLEIDLFSPNAGGREQQGSHQTGFANQRQNVEEYNNDSPLPESGQIIKRLMNGQSTFEYIA